MTDNITRFPGMGNTPEEVLAWGAKQVEAGGVATLVVTVLVDGEVEGTESLYWNGSGSRVNIHWTLTATLHSLVRRWMG